MSNHRRFLWLVAFVESIAFCAVDLTAQTFISAQAGLLHYTEGTVLVEGVPVHFDATRFFHLEQGQRLRTEDGRVEIMLVPGAFLRLEPHSEIEIVSTDLTDASVRLLEGNCALDIREIFERGATALRVAGTEVRFLRLGLYRVQKTPGMIPLLEVFLGRALVSTSEQAQKVKSGQTLSFLPEPSQWNAGKLPLSKWETLDDWTRLGETALRPSGIVSPRRTGWAALAEAFQCALGEQCGPPEAPERRRASPGFVTRLRATGAPRVRR